MSGTAWDRLGIIGIDQRDSRCIVMLEQGAASHEACCPSCECTLDARDVVASGWSFAMLVF